MLNPLPQRHPKCLKTLVRTSHAGRARSMVRRRFGEGASDRTQRFLGNQKKK